MEVGPPSFPRPSTWAVVLGNTPQGDFAPFAYGTITLCGAPFQGTSAGWKFCNSPRRWRSPPGVSRNPPRAKAATMAPVRFGLSPFRSPLLRASRLISFPRPTKRFCFGRCHLPSQKDGMTGFPPPGFPIRASGPQRLFAPPPGLSQLSTPFIASGNRGIHPGPLLPCIPPSLPLTPIQLPMCQNAIY